MTKNTKSFKSYGLVAIALISISASMPVKSTYTLYNDYAVSIHGTSNLHAWAEKVGIVSGNGTIDLAADGNFDLTALNIKLDVRSIKGDMGSIMDNNTYKALKGDANPKITFVLSTPVKSLQKSNGKMVSARGNLSIAGVTRTVDLLAKVFIQANDKLAFEGSKTINMTDYGISPPTALMGTLKTGNAITINFKLGLQ